MFLSLPPLVFHFIIFYQRCCVANFIYLFIYRHSSLVTEETSQTLLSSTHCSLVLSPALSFLHVHFLLFTCKRLVFKLDCYTVLDGILNQCYTVLDAILIHMEMQYLVIFAIQMLLILQSLLYKLTLCNKLQQCYGIYTLLCSIPRF